MLGSRTFTMADQTRFAMISGDRNPLHLDAVAARRTQAAMPAVHGVHLLLWALDVVARSGVGQCSVRRLTARFNRFLVLGEMVEATWADRNEANARFDLVLDLVSRGLTVVQITVEFGVPAGTAEGPSGSTLCIPIEPYDLTAEQIEGLAGRLAFASSPDAIAELFPEASRWLGSHRVASLAASSLLVGMVCPGLHSIYRTLAVDFCDERDPADFLGFRVVPADTRFRVVRLAVSGGGLVGTVESLLRPPPVRQAPAQELATLVRPDEFADSTALVIGGSRGLGEVTAKLLALGGARVAITYRIGGSEADVVVREMHDAGGVCRAFAYDATKEAEPQLSELDDPPTHTYYFATPAIFRAQSSMFSRARLDEFLKVYVDGFASLAQALRARRHDVSLFYPSSVFVAERPRGMLEYAMAKAAGEELCNEMNHMWAPLHVIVERLPRLLTDQTASIVGSVVESPAARLLSVVRKVQCRPLQVV